ncbi:MAG: hypothetical protein U0821_14245 [Chloroflexota bacterium]
MPATRPTHAARPERALPDGPSDADFTRLGRSRLTPARKGAITRRERERTALDSPRTNLGRFAESLGALGLSSVADALSGHVADESVTLVGRPTFFIPRDDQLWLWLDGVVGSVEIWVNDARLGPFTDADEPAWQIVDGVREGENALVIVARPTAGRELELRLLARQGSTEQEIEAARLEVVEESARMTAYVARFWGT